jgi:hypothetical protein
LQAIVLSALLLIAGAASASRAADTPQSVRADILTLIHISGSDSVGMQMGTYMAKTIIDGIRRQYPAEPDSVITPLLDAVKDEIGLIMQEELPLLLERELPLYAKHYTPDEIRELLKFYRSPIGVKMVRVGPMLVREETAAGEEWGKALQPKIGLRLKERLIRDGLIPRE